MATLTQQARQLREFGQYLRACTDAQVRGVFEKERKAGRPVYVELARAEAARRRIDLEEPQGGAR